MTTMNIAVFTFAESSTTAPSTQPTTKPSTLQRLDVHFIVQGYCHAGSRDDPKASGYSRSGDPPTDVPKTLPTHDGEIELIVAAAPVAFTCDDEGVTLYLVNSTAKEAAFVAMDSLISVVQEALDSDGKWKPIEQLSWGLCGNSYHHVFLPAGTCWSFVAPRYSGERATKLRFRLDSEDGKRLTSNEFEGRIDVEQFKQKRGH